MQRIKRVLDIQYNALHKKSWDNVLLITGDEGTGKSHLALNILEYWLQLKYNEVKNEDIKFINLDIGKWADSFAQCKKGDMNILDESGDISNKRSMSQLNFAISRAYQIIRGDNINSVFVLPSLFDLDGYFTKRRAKGLLYVYKRGKVAFWSKNRLRKIIEINQNNSIKNIWAIKPNFVDHFPIYKGLLKDKYEELKANYMKETRKELSEAIKKIKGSNEISERDQLILKLKKKIGTSKTSELIGMSGRNIQLIAKKHNEERSDERH